MRLRMCAVLGVAALAAGCAAPETGMIRGIVRMPANLTARDVVVSVQPLPPPATHAQAASASASIGSDAPPRTPASAPLRAPASAPPRAPASLTRAAVAGPRAGVKPRPGHAAPARPIARVVQRHHRFVPRVLPVAAGDTVLFRNADEVWHNAFSISPARAFDLGPFGPGAMRRLRFDHPGVVQVFSGMDPEMSGYIVVLRGRRFARPDGAGAFQFADLAPGRYDVHAWSPELGERTACVTVTPNGSAVLRFTF